MPDRLPCEKLGRYKTKFLLCARPRVESQNKKGRAVSYYQKRLGFFFTSEFFVWIFYVCIVLMFLGNHHHGNRLSSLVIEKLVTQSARGLGQLVPSPCLLFIALLLQSTIMLK